MWDVIAYALIPMAVQLNGEEFRVWMSNYFPLVFVHVITYPCSNRHVGLANLPLLLRDVAADWNTYAFCLNGNSNMKWSNENAWLNMC